MKKTTSVIVMAIIIILAACEENLPEKFKPANSSPTGEVSYETQLFVTSEDTGTVLFETNDPQYWSDRGYTAWFLRAEAAEEFTSRQVQVAKLSGNLSAGYGLVYCQHEDAQYGNTMLAVLVNLRQEYQVVSVTANGFKEIIPWTESLLINNGYNQHNVIRLDYDAGEDLFSLYFNDQPETTFQEEDEPKHTNGRQGYMVVISPLDDFPDIPVKVCFEELPGGLR